MTLLLLIMLLAIPSWAEEIYIDKMPPGARPMTPEELAKHKARLDAQQLLDLPPQKRIWTEKEIQEADAAMDALPDCPPEPTYEERAKAQAKNPKPPIDVTRPEHVKKSREAMARAAREGPKCIDKDEKLFYKDYRRHGEDVAHENLEKRRGKP